MADEKKQVDEKKDAEPAVEDWQKKADEYLAGWKRARADYDNLQKQTLKDRAEFMTWANQEIISALLPVIDNFEQALKHRPEAEKLSEEDRKIFMPWFQGVEIIYKHFLDILKQYRVEKIKIGEKFDPATMEAVETREEAGREEGEIVEVIVSGYLMGDRVIRPARVAVNRISE
jgi:molecular chaperone GrpE